MADEGLRHLSLRKIDIQYERKKSKKKIPQPTRPPNVEYGKELELLVQQVEEDYKASMKVAPPEFDPALIFRIKLDKTQVPDEQWERSQLTVLSEEPGGYVVLFSADQLAEFRSRIEKYGEEIQPDKKGPQYAWIASLATDMKLWGKEDRIGKKLSKIEICPNERYLLDVELWAYGERQDWDKRMNELKTYIINSGGEFLDKFVSVTINVARVRTNGETLEHLLDVGIVERIDIPPQPDIYLGQLINTQIDDFKAPINPPVNDAPSICIIDSGIAVGHPLIGPAIGDVSSIPTKIGLGIDDHGHGTMVAGVALYGDVEQAVSTLNFEPNLYIYGAKVTNKEGKFDDERLIVNQMSEAIRYFSETYGCRIFNISLGDPSHVFSDGRPSLWAQILDTLAAELDVLILVSAGNFNLRELSSEEAELYQDRYPKYLLELEDARIIEPATAVNALTVGSLARSEASKAAARYPNDPSIRIVADINQPSPFTRSGPGVNGSIKPDVCDYGGNSVWSGYHRRIYSDDPETGIMTMSHEPGGRPFTIGHGTSLATPKVAYLAGQILVHYPGISANLIRALIANSASIPIAVSELGLSYEEQLRLCGYGQPNHNAALYSNEHRVTLTAEDEIPLNGVHIFQVPIPVEFKESKGKRKVSVCLAYDPPVRFSRKEYLGIKMDYDLIRGLSTEEIVKLYANVDAEMNEGDQNEENEEGNDASSSYKCKMDINWTLRRKNTLQKGIWNISRSTSITNYAGDVLHLVVRSYSTPWVAQQVLDGQRYALAITLEHSDEQVQFYNSIQQFVRQQQRVRIRQ